MKGRKTLGLISLVVVGMLTTTGIVFALGTGATIGGGVGNTAEGDYATVGGGANNTADGDFSTIAGGGDPVGGNTASGIQSTIGGGVGNSATGNSDTVSGGFANVASDGGATIGGGSFNISEGNGATIGGGGRNNASGIVATIPGGALNVAAGDYSFAAGRRAKANHDCTFAWADATDEDFASTGDNQFLIRASGGVGIGTNSPNEMLVVGDPLASSLPGNRITIGNDSGRSGINLGEDQNHRAFILWEDNNNYLELGTRDSGGTHGNNLVIKQGNIGISDNDPSEKLTVNGNVLADDFLTPSSRALKTNIEGIEGALATVQNLRGVSYDWKETGEHDIGLIAEEVGKVLPEVVAYAENGVDAKAVDYARLVPLLIEAVKEQQELLEDRDAQVASLEARISALEELTGTEAKEVQTGSISSSPPGLGMLAGGFGLLLVTPGLMLGYWEIEKRRRISS